MACTPAALGFPDATPEQLCKVAIRLRMSLVRLTDARTLDEDRTRAREAWLKTDEAEGCYIAFIQWGDDNWVKRFEGLIYAFSHADTGFAFKLRFG